MEVSGQLQALAVFLSNEKALIPILMAWMGSRAVLELVAK
jgi:hypothetical protein